MFRLPYVHGIDVVEMEL